jgi:N-acetylmuramoyl-L-alanine amidase
MTVNLQPLPKKQRRAWMVVCILLGLLFISLLQADEAKATEPVTVFVNHTQLSIPQHEFVFRQDRLFLPLRVVAESLGAHVGWDETEQRITITMGERQTELWIGREQYLHQGRWTTMDISPFLHHGKTLVPIRLVSEGLGYHVEWEDHTRRVLIGDSPAIIAHMRELSLDQLYWLARIISAEAEGEPFQGQVAVGAVVMNRVHHPTFPNTIYGVIFDKFGPHYQFEPVQNGRIFEVTPNYQNLAAARRALAGEDPTNGTLFFHNPSISSNAWMAAKPVSIRIGKHVFAY